MLGLPIGLTVLTALRPDSVRLAIGGVILASVLMLWRGFRLPPNPSRALTAVFGLAGGVMSGLASMGGPPIVVYLIALSHRAVVVRASSIVYFMLAGTLSLVLLLWRGLIDREIVLWSIASIPVLFAGNHVGNWGFRRSKAHHHRNTALVTLSVLAGMLIVARPQRMALKPIPRPPSAGAVSPVHDVPSTPGVAASRPRAGAGDLGTGGSIARSMSRTSASSAACRLRSCVRKRCAVISISPC